MRRDDVMRAAQKKLKLLCDLKYRPRAIGAPGSGGSIQVSRWILNQVALRVGALGSGSESEKTVADSAAARRQTKDAATA